MKNYIHKYKYKIGLYSRYRDAHVIIHLHVYNLYAGMYRHVTSVLSYDIYIYIISVKHTPCVCV